MNASLFNIIRFVAFLLLILNISLNAQEILPTAAVKMQWESFKKVYPKSEIEWDKQTGTPREIRVFVTNAYSGTVLQRAQNFLKEYAALFGMKKDLSDLKYLTSTKTAIEGKTGIDYIKFQQVYNELPVIGTETMIHLTETGKVFRVYNRYYPTIQIENNKKISQEQAIELVKKKVKPKKLIPLKDFAEMTVYPKEGKFYYAWQVQVGEWRYYINAENGDVLSSYSTLLHQLTCTGKVYEENKCKTPTIIDGNLPNLDNSGYLRGTNFDVQTLSGNRASSSNCVFDYNVSSNEFDQVEIYYQLERMRAYLGDLGYQPQPTQTIAYANSSTYPCNAGYDLGSNYFEFGYAYDPGCNGLLCYSPGQDGNTIIHEYGHQVVHQLANLNIDPNTNPNSHLTLAIHEAVADYFSCSFFNDPCMSETLDDTQCSTCLRNIDNTNTFPNDVHPTDSHITALILSGALWDIRKDADQATTDWLVYETLKAIPNNSDFSDFAARSLDVIVAKIDEIDEWWAKLILALFAVAVRDKYCAHGIVPSSPYSCD